MMLNTLAMLLILVFQVLLWRKVVNLREDTKKLSKVIKKLSERIDDMEELIEDTSEDERVERIRNILEADK